MLRSVRVALAGAVLVSCAGASDPAPPGAGPTTAPRSGRSVVAPPVGASWQYQLSGPLDPTVDAHVFDVDGDETTAAQVDDLHRRGRYVVCYLSAGTSEAWRSDASRFPASVIGRPLADWPGERWLDVRRLDVLRPILARRIEGCARKGFDAVELDNVDGYRNASGFALSAADQLAFNRAIAAVAHRSGLAVGLKNDAEQAPALVGAFDFAIVEECVANDECGSYASFVDADKPVFLVEYAGSHDAVCAEARRRRFSAIGKDLDLGPARRPC